MTTEEVIGLDVGMARTGLARASRRARLAEPLKTVATDELSEELRHWVEQGVRQVVVGLPRNLSGDDTAQTNWVRQLVESLKIEHPQLLFHWQDEALTTAAAQAGKNVTDIDAEAARIILQDFLDGESTA